MASYSFRSALNGFNREDVVHYLEYINTKNANATAQLENELQQAQEALTQAREGAEFKARCQALEQDNAEILAQNEALMAQIAELEARLSKAEIRSESELEAYRRAETVERQARQRADALCQKANGILADTQVKVDEAYARLSAASDLVTAQLQDLQKSVQGSKTVLQEAVTALYTVRPEEE